MNYSSAPSDKIKLLSKAHPYDFILSNESFDSHHYSCMPIAQAKLLLVASRPLTDDINKQTFLANSRDSPLFCMAEKLFDVNRDTMFLSDQQSVKKAALLGLGVAILPEYLIYNELKEQRLIEIPQYSIDEKMDINLYVQKYMQDNKLLLELIESLKNVCHNLA